MRNQEVYSAKNVISLVIIFCVLFWLLYSIGSFLHESKKISDEIDAIKKNNVEIEESIEAKKEELEYLKTPQRIEKEAKMQMGKKVAGEQVLVFIEEKLELLPTEAKKEIPKRLMAKLPNWKKWQLFFWGQ